jgi:two-component system, sensor histidine kinase RegB
LPGLTRNSVPECFCVRDTEPLAGGGPVGHSQRMVDHVLLNRVGAPQLLRLDTLVKLRWLAVTGQMLAIIVVHFGFGFPLPILTALAIIAVSALLNIALQVRFPRTHRIEDGAAATLLAYDVVQLAALLYLTGGLENPFSILFLAPVLISATALPPTRTMLLGALATVAVTVLAVWHQPLPWLANDSIRLPRLYVGGVWLSLLLGLTFIGVYAWRVAEEARQLGHALTATELVLAREQHLSQLDGLAAAAAHELGTPLATIALVVRELDRAIGSESPHKDDIVLLSEQTSRCRQILAKIATLGTEPEGLMNTIGIRQLLEEVSAPQRPFGVRIVMEAEGPHPDPVLLRSAGLIYGLENLIDNAVDFATTTVSISAAWTDQYVSIMITDDGPGFAVEVLKRLGEPYVTTRRLDPPSGSSSGGLGLGLFIAKTLLERGGAQFEARNRTDSARGAAVKLTWKRAVFERRETSARTSLAGASAMGHPVTVP